MSHLIRRSAAAAMAVALLVGSVGNAFATVRTDQPDYSPGSVVTIAGDNGNGAGYVAGETVHVDVSGPNGYTSSCDALADATGAWSCQITLWNSDLAVGDYTYTATGLVSGVTETGTFTDKTNTDLTLGISPSAVGPSGAVTFTATLTVHNGAAISGESVSLSGPWTNNGCNQGSGSTFYTANTDGSGQISTGGTAPATDGTVYYNAHYEGSSTYNGKDDCKPLVVDTAPSVSSTTPANGATGVATNANIDVTFSEPVHNTDTWYDITCGSSGGHTATVSGGPTSFTLDPTTDFTAGEHCTVTFYAAHVHDNDTDDPPDTMAADYVFSFDVAGVAVTPTLTTEVRDTTNTPGISFPEGTTVHDHLSIDPSDAAGDITFKLYSGTACTDPGSPIDTWGPTALSGGTADSGGDGGLPVGTYYYFVIYTSDDANQWNNTSTCEQFSITAGPVSPAVSTEVRDSVDGTGTGSPPAFDLGSIIHDFVTIFTGGNDVPSGSSVSFGFYVGGDCGTGTLSPPVDSLDFGGSPLSSPVSGSSDPRGPLHAGDYAYQAAFNSGDTGSVTNGQSDCEPFTVKKADTTVTTVVRDASNNPVSGPVAPGDFHDRATIGVANGGYAGFNLDPVPSNVHFTLYDNSTCNGTVLQTDLKLVSGTPPQTVESTPYTAVAGSYSYQVHYDGNSDYKAMTSDCEAFTVANPSNQITALSDFHAWVGLKNSDDQGTQFDLKVDLYDGTTLVASGLQRCVTGITRNPTFAKDVPIAWTFSGPFAVATNDILSVKVSTRIGTTSTGAKCPGPGGSHSSAVGLRLYYDSTLRASGFDATIAAANADYYLRSDGNPCLNAESTGVTTRYLSTTAPTVTTVAGAKCKDSGAVNYAGGNLWKEIGTWFYTLP